LAKCGSPLSIVEIGSKKRNRGNGTITRQETEGNNAAYRTRPNRSSAALKLEAYILRFEGDTLIKITSTLEKGN
jgi:hypothetical protein